MQCATHPGVETELRCATCGKPICPDCLMVPLLWVFGALAAVTAYWRIR